MTPLRLANGLRVRRVGDGFVMEGEGAAFELGDAARLATWIDRLLAAVERRTRLCGSMGCTRRVTGHMKNGKPYKTCARCRERCRLNARRG